MALAKDRTPQLRIVNAGGTPTEGPYDLQPMGSTGPAPFGLTIGTIDAWEEIKQDGPRENFNWQLVSTVYGYRLHMTIRFVSVESDLLNSAYGLTLIHRLWRTSVESQGLSYGPLQFRMFNAATWRAIVPGGQEFHPTLIEGKQGYYELDLPFQTRELVAAPGEWSQGQW